MSVTLASSHAAWDWFAPHPVPLLVVVAAALLYTRAVSVLATRGRRVPVSQRSCYYAGLTMIALATQTGIDTVGETDLVSVHMLQHLLIADLPAPLLLLGLRAPVLYFFWPRPVLVTFARIRPLRAIWSVLRRPPVALAVWLALLVGWHVPAAYNAATQSPVLHGFEHLSFALGGVLAWWPVLDPTHERLEGRVWKALYVVAARTLGGVLGIIMIAWPTQLYTAYGNRSLAWGLSPVTDQQVAGAMMMAVDFVIVTAGFFWFIATTGRQQAAADAHVAGPAPASTSPSVSPSPGPAGDAPTDAGWTRQPAGSAGRPATRS
jgi:putative membrane protein